MLKRIVSIMLCAAMLMSLCVINVSATLPSEEVFKDEYKADAKTNYYYNYEKSKFGFYTSDKYGDTDFMRFAAKTSVLTYDFQASGATAVKGFTGGFLTVHHNKGYGGVIVKGGSDVSNLIELNVIVSDGTYSETQLAGQSWYKTVYEIIDIPVNCRYISIAPAGKDGVYEADNFDLLEFTLHSDFGVSMLNRSGVYSLGADAEQSATTTHSARQRYALSNSILLEAAVSSAKSCTGVKFYANSKLIGTGTDADGDGVYTCYWRPALNTSGNYDNAYNFELDPIDAGVYNVYAVASYNGGSVRSDSAKIALDDPYVRVEGTSGSLVEMDEANLLEGGFWDDDTSATTRFKFNSSTGATDEGTQTLVAYEEVNKRIKISSIAGLKEGKDPNVSNQNLFSYPNGVSTDSGIYEIFVRMMVEKESGAQGTNVNIRLDHNAGAAPYSRSICFRTDGKIGYWKAWDMNTSSNFKEFDKPITIDYGKIYDIKMYYDSVNSKALVYINGERVTNDWVTFGVNADYSYGKGTLKRIVVGHASSTDAVQNTYLYAMSCYPVSANTAAQLKDISVGTSDLRYVKTTDSTIMAVFSGAVVDSTLTIYKGEDVVGTYTASEDSATNTYTYDISGANLAEGTEYTLKIGEKYATEIKTVKDQFTITELCCTDFSKLTEGKSIETIVKYENSTGASGAFVPITAIYENGILKNVIAGNAMVKANEATGEVTRTYTLPEGFDSAKYTVKVFAWDSMERIAPIAEAELFPTVEQ